MGCHLNCGFLAMKNGKELEINFNFPGFVTKLIKFLLENKVNFSTQNRYYFADGWLFLHEMGYENFETPYKLNITIKEFFNRIDALKDEDHFYYPMNSGEYLKTTPNYYDSYMAEFAFDRECIIDCNYDKTEHVKNMSELMDVSGYIMYSEIPHIPSFYIKRYTTLAEVVEVMHSVCGLCNAFSGNIIILHYGIPLKYRVKNKHNQYITCEDIDFSTDKSDILYIEWEVSKGYETLVNTFQVK